MKKTKTKIMQNKIYDKKNVRKQKYIYIYIYQYIYIYIYIYILNN